MNSDIDSKRRRAMAWLFDLAQQSPGQTFGFFMPTYRHLSVIAWPMALALADECSDRPKIRKIDGAIEFPNGGRVLLADMGTWDRPSTHLRGVDFCDIVLDGPNTVAHMDEVLQLAHNRLRGRRFDGTRGSVQMFAWD